jgi:hypothetical protein
MNYRIEERSSGILVICKATELNEERSSDILKSKISPLTRLNLRKILIATKISGLRPSLFLTKNNCTGRYADNHKNNKKSVLFKKVKLLR